MKSNHTVISISRLTKKDLDKLKEEFGELSYDKLISKLLLDHYKNKI